MDKTCKDKILACRTYAEAKPILETAKVSLSAHELAHTAYAIQEKQPELAKSFLTTVIQEAEEQMKPKNIEAGTVREVDGGTSNQSSSISGLEKIGKDTDPESMQKQADAKDQMGVPINETWPPQQYGGFPPTGGMSPMGMPQQRPPMPPQQQQFMQYTVNETIRFLAPRFDKIVEAIQALDKKVQETAKSQINSLAVGDKLGKQGTHTFGSFVRETVEGNTQEDLAIAGTEITRMNDAINQGFI